MMGSACEKCPVHRCNVSIPCVCVCVHTEHKVLDLSFVRGKDSMGFNESRSQRLQIVLC